MAMNTEDFTTITISRATRQRMEDLKLHPKQTTEELLSLLLDGRLDEIQKLKGQIASLTKKSEHNAYKADSVGKKEKPPIGESLEGSYFSKFFEVGEL